MITKRFSHHWPLLLCVWLLFSLPGRMTAQTQADSLRARFPYTAMEFAPLPSLLELDGVWRDLNKKASVEIPFTFSDGLSHQLWYEFELNCEPDEEIYLLFEGIAWQAELILNQQYLGVHDDPFAPWIVPIQQEWLRTSGKQLIEVRLTKGRRFADYPQSFTGIFRPAKLLTKDQLAAYQIPSTQPDSLHARIAIVAPYFGKSGYVFSEVAASKLMVPLLNEKIRQVYFPFSPGRKLYNLLRQFGIESVATLPDTTRLCAINAYPEEPGSISTHRYYWLDESGKRTTDYLSFFPNVSRLNRPPDIQYRGLLALMMLFPLLGLFLIKWISPNFFQSMTAILFAPKLHVDTFADSTFANLGLVFLLIAIKTVLMGIFLTLFIYYIQLEHQWEVLNVWKENSLISWIFYGAVSLPAILFRSLLLQLTWLTFKYVSIWIFGKLYGFRGMPLAMLNLDIVSAFPLILLLSIPLSIIFFGAKLWGGIFLGIIFIIWATYILRRLYVYYIGLDRLYMLSFGVKILYICAFIILPYIILF